MSSSVVVGLMTLSTTTCCACATVPRAFAPAAAIPPPKAAATTMPATNAPANPAVPVILHFIIVLLTLVVLPQSTTENSKSECMLIQLGRAWFTISIKRESTLVNAKAGQIKYLERNVRLPAYRELTRLR